MDATKFAWVYLIEHGVAGMEPSFYGGYKCCDDRMKSVELSWNEQYQGHRNVYLKEIKEIGVDWNKTIAPESSMYSQFQGTFCDSKYQEFIQGTIVLKNGKKQTWTAESIEVTNVFEMMTKADEIKQKYQEIFGDD